MEKNSNLSYDYHSNYMHGQRNSKYIIIGQFH